MVARQKLSHLFLQEVERNYLTPNLERRLIVNGKDLSYEIKPQVHEMNISKKVFMEFTDLILKRNSIVDIYGIYTELWSCSRESLYTSGVGSRSWSGRYQDAPWY